MPTLTYEPIANFTVVTPANSVTFSSIPQTFTDLRVVCKVKEASSYADARIRFNGDSGSNYNGRRFFVSGSTPGAGAFTNANGVWIGQNSNNNVDWSQMTTDIASYSSTTVWKTTLSETGTGRINNQTPQYFNFVWQRTDAITSLSILIPDGTTNWAAGSKFAIYGIKAQ
jgi:hypothetical protein